MPQQFYQKLKNSNKLQQDALQEKIVSIFEQQKAQLLDEDFMLKKRLLPGKKRRRQITGLYLWGDVGRGKTMLMDIFYTTLPLENKLRMHFHAFMQMVHRRLNEYKNERDPLIKVARLIATEHRVLCLDECHVNDIADAMILGKLATALFVRRVMLITTSNRPPADLYKDGLQRELFLPAIDAIVKHCRVINLDGKYDYRAISFDFAQVFYTPIDKAADFALQTNFNKYGNNTPPQHGNLNLDGRNIAYLGKAKNCIWFDFATLCVANRANSEYAQIAAGFEYVLVQNVPQLDKKSDDAARRLLNLLDIFYDKKVKLIMSMQTDIDNLYIGKRLEFEFARAKSRLLEMQSAQYLELKHLS